MSKAIALVLSAAMKSSFLLLVAVGGVVAPSTARADKFGMNGFGWEVARTVGDARDVHDSVSLHGWAVDQRFFVLPALTLGFGLSEQFFDDSRPKATFEVPSGALTGKLYDFSNAFQWKFLAHYYFFASSPVKPVVGLGIGYGWFTRQTWIADVAYDRSQSAFVLAPEVGLLATARKDWPAGLMVVAKYNYSTADFESIESFSYFGGVVGGYVSY